METEKKKHNFPPTIRAFPLFLTRLETRSFEKKTNKAALCDVTNGINKAPGSVATPPASLIPPSPPQLPSRGGSNEALDYV